MPPPRSSGPSALFLRTKQLDGHRGREWTYLVAASRVAALELAAPATLHYEPLDSRAQVLSFLASLKHLRRLSAPELALPTLTLGLRWHRSGFYATQGRLPALTTADEFVGRHSVKVLGRSGSTIVFQNSWSGWGDAFGRGHLSLEDFDSYVDAIWLQRNTPYWSGLGNEPISAWRRRAAAQWPTIDPTSETVLVDGSEFSRHQTSIESGRTGRRVEILEFRNASHGVGRAHLHLISGENARLDELYVWPMMRRRGIGSALVARVAALARAAGYTSIEVPLFEADALSTDGPAGAAFAAALGMRVTPLRPPEGGVHALGSVRLDDYSEP